MHIDLSRGERVGEYVDHFGQAPPLLYMVHLSDQEFAARVAQAIDSAQEITAEEFEGADVGLYKTVY